MRLVALLVLSLLVTAFVPLAAADETKFVVRTLYWEERCSESWDVRQNTTSEGNTTRRTSAVEGSRACERHDETAGVAFASRAANVWAGDASDSSSSDRYASRSTSTTGPCPDDAERRCSRGEASGQSTSRWRHDSRTGADVQAKGGPAVSVDAARCTGATGFDDRWNQTSSKDGSRSTWEERGTQRVGVKHRCAGGPEVRAAGSSMAAYFEECDLEGGSSSDYRAVDRFSNRTSTWSGHSSSRCSYGPHVVSRGATPLDLTGPRAQYRRDKDCIDGACREVESVGLEGGPGPVVLP